MSNYYTIEGRKYNLTEEGKNFLIEEYSSGLSKAKVAKEMGVSEETITRWMKENNIESRRRKYPINEQYFDIIDSPEKAYWLGFLSADGYIHKRRGELQFELQEKDKLQVEKFRDAIGSKAPILEIRTGEEKQFLHYRFSVKCRKMVDTLEKYGIVQNKSLIFYPKNIPPQFMGYWIVGYMDGDGCVYNAKGRLRICFTGTQKTLQIIKDYFNSNNQIRLEHRCNNTYKFALEVALSENFLSSINYKNLDFALERKKCVVASLI